MAIATKPLELFSAVYLLLTPLFTLFYGLGADEFSVFSSKESLFVVAVVDVTLVLSPHSADNMYSVL